VTRQQKSMPKGVLSQLLRQHPVRFREIYGPSISTDPQSVSK